MRIIISPAKKMKVDTDSLPWQEVPVFLYRCLALGMRTEHGDFSPRFG